MVWSFHRDGKQLSYEILPAAREGGAFEIVIHEPEGSHRVERFDTAAEVDERARQLQQQLIHDGWWLASDPRR
jgi:hypothetical protein